MLNYPYHLYCSNLLLGITNINNLQKLKATQLIEPNVTVRGIRIIPVQPKAKPREENQNFRRYNAREVPESTREYQGGRKRVVEGKIMYIL